MINDVQQKRNFENSSLLLTKYPVESFHSAIGPILRVCQWFGLLPVVGLLEKDPSSLKLKWLSWQMFHCVGVIGCGAVFTVLTIYYFLATHFTPDTFGLMTYYCAAFTAQVLFFNLSRNWPQLCNEIKKVEDISSFTPRPSAATKHQFTLRTTFKLWSFSLLSLAFVNHTLFIMGSMTFAYNCFKHLPLFEGHFMLAYPQIYTVTKWSPWITVLSHIASYPLSFAWTFMDLFLVLMSKGLSHRFEYLNQTLLQTMGKEFPTHFWMAARNEYAHLCRLVEYADRFIGPIILLSFSQNLYVICWQLFHWLRSGSAYSSGCWLKQDNLLGNLLTPLYFGFTFLFIIVRFLAVAFSAAEIHTASKKPLGPLFYVSRRSYSIEVSRFLDHVITESVSLSGINIFYITKGFIFSVVGTVITYELVLIQFFFPQNTSCQNLNGTKQQ